MDRIEQIAKSHWLPNESDAEHADRVEAATNEAHSFFTAATTRQLEAHRQTMNDIRYHHGSPAWRREKAAADRLWDESTFPARELFFVTFEELLRTGEVSERVSLMWDELLPAKVIKLPVVPVGFFDHPAQPEVARIFAEHRQAAE